MKSGSGSRDATPPLRHVKHLQRADDVTAADDVTDRRDDVTATAREIVERGRTRNALNRFQVGSKVNVCGSRSKSRTFDGAGCVVNKQKVLLL